MCTSTICRRPSCDAQSASRAIVVPFDRGAALHLQLRFLYELRRRPSTERRSERRGRSREPADQKQQALDGPGTVTADGRGGRLGWATTEPCRGRLVCTLMQIPFPFPGKGLPLERPAGLRQRSSPAPSPPSALALGPHGPAAAIACVHSQPRPAGLRPWQRRDCRPLSLTPRPALLGGRIAARAARARAQGAGEAEKSRSGRGRGAPGAQQGCRGRGLELRRSEPSRARHLAGMGFTGRTSGPD